MCSSGEWSAFIESADHILNEAEMLMNCQDYAVLESLLARLHSVRSATERIENPGQLAYKMN